MSRIPSGDGPGMELKYSSTSSPWMRPNAPGQQSVISTTIEMTEGTGQNYSGNMELGAEALPEGNIAASVTYSNYVSVPILQ